MKTTILSISAAIVLTSIAVACTSPAPTGPASTNSDLSGNDDSKSTSSNKPAASSTAKAPTATAKASATAPAPTTSASGAPGQDPEEAQFKQCMTQCAGTDQKALQIFNTTMACLDKCNIDDQNCGDACFSNSVCATDQSVAASCDTLDNCDMKCEPDDPGGPGGPQQMGPNGGGF